MRLGLTALGVYVHSDRQLGHASLHKRFIMHLINMGSIYIDYTNLKPSNTPIVSYLKKQVDIVRKTITKVTNNRVGIYNTNLTRLLSIS